MKYYDITNAQLCSHKIVATSYLKNASKTSPQQWISINCSEYGQPDRWKYLVYNMEEQMSDDENMKKFFIGYNFFYILNNDFSPPELEKPHGFVQMRRTSWFHADQNVHKKSYRCHNKSVFMTPKPDKLCHITQQYIMYIAIP